jgi:hypothetical protein
MPPIDTSSDLIVQKRSPFTVAGQETVGYWLRLGDIGLKSPGDMNQ